MLAIKEYCKQTIQWSESTNNGYGDTYGANNTINNVYVEKTDTNILIICFTFYAFKKDDLIIYDNINYKIDEVKEYFKQKSVNFNHLEVKASKVNYEK